MEVGEQSAGNYRHGPWPGAKQFGVHRSATIGRHFLDENGGGPGVRLRKRQPKKG